jgi:NAD(P)-dependent dehydrogenase (short-subunit alcohol dehydrogenase family)
MAARYPGDLVYDRAVPPSYVVTGGARGIGRAIAERLTATGHVVVLDADPEALGWAEGAGGLSAVAGDAGDEAVAGRAADAAEAHGPLAGWVNNAAVFRDAALHAAPAREVLDLVALNLGLALTGCAVAVRRFLAAGTKGAIVNVSSHQAQRPVPGALPYATAKAAVEGLTRALAVDYGPAGIRTNAVALGSIVTGRYAAMAGEGGGEAAIRRLHPLGRAGRAEEVAAVVAHLLSAEAAFVNGAVLPVDGGRAALGQDPEARAVLEPRP